MRWRKLLLRQRLRARAASMPAVFVNVAEGRCPDVAGEGFGWSSCSFCQRLLTMPTCPGAYNAETLKIAYRGKSIADVLVSRSMRRGNSSRAKLRYAARSTCCVKWGSAICASASRNGTLRGEAQRIKLATELQRTQRGDTLYVLDEPTTGLHPADVES